MAGLTRLLSLALAVAIIVAAVAACTSGGGGGDLGYQDGEPIDFVSADPQRVLDESAEYFQEDVESLQAEMDFTMTLGGVEMDAAAALSFRSPDKMHMTLKITGLGTFEALAIGSDMWVNVPSRGWVSFNLEETGSNDLGLDVQAFTDAFNDHSPVDYEQVIRSMGGEVENLGPETIDGGTYQHYRGTIAFEDVLASFSDGFGTTADLNLDEASGPLSLDVWVDTETLLPYMADLQGEIAFGVTPMTFDATLTFLGYNQPVDIPAPPADAVSLSELFSGSLQQ
jgi:hypothetical protein